MIERPPFCKFNYCPDGVACMDAWKCLSIDGLPGKVEYPDGKTSPPIKESLLMEQLLKSASDGRPNTENKLSGKGGSYERFLASKIDDSMAAASSPDEIGWVIVRDLPQGLGYWDGRDFSLANLHAVRFARKIDAELIRNLYANYKTDRVEEHMWITKP